MKEYIEINYKNQILRGYNHKNNNTKVVVMLHGFTGNKTETRSMYKKLSESLEVNGFDSIRVDYLGHGESDGQFSDMHFLDLCNQGATVIQYAKSKEYKEVYLIGYSMGGLIGLHLLTPDIEKAVLISPAVKMNIGISNRFNNNLLPNGNKDIGGYELGAKFRDSLELTDVLKYKDFSNPTLFICGTKDQAVNYQDVAEVENEFANSCLELFKDCDHGYSSLEFYCKLETMIIDFLK